VSAFLNEPLATESVGAARYEFLPPYLSDDRLVATLPVDGFWTLGSRSKFEHLAAHLLWTFLPLEFREQLRVGLTEPDFHDSARSRTDWYDPMEPIERVLAGARLLSRGAEGAG